MVEEAPTERELAAASRLATFPPDDVPGRLLEARELRLKDDGGSVFRTDTAAAVLGALEPAAAWRLLTDAAERRISYLTAPRPPGTHFDIDKARVWRVILWHNAVEFARRAGAPVQVCGVAHRLVGQDPWSGTLDELLTAASVVVAS